MSDMPSALLEIERLDVAYGIVQVLSEVTLRVAAGEIVTLIGANGAGKTTLLRTISGLLCPRAGTIRFAGDDTTRIPAHALVARGLAHAPEGRRIFGRMTVRENLLLGGFVRRDRHRMTEDIERVLGRFPRLAQRIDQVAGRLSGGEQQMLAIGRALLSRPRLLLLDEPSLGLAPIIVEELFALIRELNADGTAILLVEQNAMQALTVASRAYVLELGRIVRTAPSADLLVDESIREAYLGAA